MANPGEGTPRDDILIGGSQNDTIDGGRGDDVIDGGSQSDILRGEEGRDIVLGGSGDDMLRGATGDDYLRGGSGDDFVNGGEERDFVEGGRGDDHVLGGLGNDRLWGGEGDDTLRGSDGADILVGGRGNDVLIGGDGVDRFVYFGESDDDLIYHFEPQKDVIDLRLLPEAVAFSDLSFVDLADGGGVRITLPALDGSIELRGIAASDLTASNFALPDGSTTSITLGATTIHASGRVVDGAFLVDGANGTRLVGRESADHVLAGEGNDRIEGRGGDDILFGEEGHDRILGGTGNDWLFGGEENDSLDGGADDDRLHGGEGNDELTGGAGSDVFAFGMERGFDRVTDFTRGEDRIDLSAFAEISGFDDLEFSTHGNIAVLDLSCHGGGVVRLDNIGEDAPDAADFVFHEPAVDAM